MIGMVGTNRLSPQGLEVGYCANIAYWGHGYTTEAFSAFLKYYWTLPGIYISPIFPFPFFTSRGAALNLICRKEGNQQIGC